MSQFRVLLVVLAGLFSATCVLAANSTTTTSKNNIIVSDNGTINKEAAVNQIQKQINSGDIVQPSTGIMKTDPDTIVATGVAKQNPNAAVNPSTTTQGAPIRATSGVPQNQAQQLQQTATGGNTPLIDPDVQAAQKAAQSVPTTPAPATSAGN